MAKLAVLISSPMSPTTHWSFSDPSRRSIAGAVPFPADADGEFGPTQGRWLDLKAPRSRANCSNVSGRKEPIAPLWLEGLRSDQFYEWSVVPTPHTAKTSAAMP
jgi:hypothetical protein